MTWWVNMKRAIWNNTRELSTRTSCSSSTPRRQTLRTSWNLWYLPSHLSISPMTSWTPSESWSSGSSGNSSTLARSWSASRWSLAWRCNARAVCSRKYLTWRRWTSWTRVRKPSNLYSWVKTAKSTKSPLSNIKSKMYTHNYSSLSPYRPTNR